MEEFDDMASNGNSGDIEKDKCDKIIVEDVNDGEDSGFASIADTQSYKNNVEQKQETTEEEEEEEEENKAEVVKRRREEREAKHKHRMATNRALREKYNEERRQNGYKRLLHLVSRSKFYSDFLVNKLKTTTDNEAEIKNQNRGRRVANKKRKAMADENDQQDEKIIKLAKKDNRKKLNLSQEHIEKLLFEQQGQGEDESDNNIEINVAPTREAFVPPKYFTGALRDYQQTGLDWLKTLFDNGMGGILADEMGLGKTVQVIAMIAHLVEKKQSGPYLIIAPLSTIPNWIMEFERFAPNLPVVVYHGPEADRLKQAKQIKAKTKVDGFSTQPVVLTTYEMPVRNANFFRRIQWRYLVVDEGQRIKSCDTQLFKILQDCKSMNRLLLTGTPLQNDLKELWSLLNFLMPDIFDDLAVFESWFTIEDFQDEAGTNRLLQQEEEKKILQSFRDILKPFMLRRLKSEVCIDIPPKREVIVYVPMTQLQKNLYEALLNYDLEVLSKKQSEPLIIDDEFGKRPKRKCALKNIYSGVYRDPYKLPSTSNQDEDHDSSTIERKMKKFSEYASITDENRHYFFRLAMGNSSVLFRKVVNHPYLIHLPLNDVGLPKIDDELISASGKLMVLDKMLNRLKKEGHRVLLFSTMTMILDIIEDYINMKSWNFLRLDGAVGIEDRKESIQLFNNDPKYFIFLITARSGGVGLNLVGADTVIIFDSDWNPQVDIQAMARCHRIGQTKPVVIYKLCTKGTYDEAIISRANAKRKLEKLVISKDIERISLNSKEGLIMLKELLDSNKEERIASQHQIFTESELDRLMDRSDLIAQMANNNQG